VLPNYFSGAFVATVKLTKDNFEQIVTGSPVVAIDFWASWCGPCRMFAPIFEAASDKYPNVVFAKVNTEEEQELAANFNIRSIPTLMIVRDRVVLFSQAGALPASALDQVLDKALALDMDEVHREIEAQEAQPQS
jgi:thioredoxin 1